MSIKGTLRNVAKRSYGMRRLMRAVYYGGREIRYRVNSLGKRTDPELIVFQSFAGRSYSDTPKAVYEYMLQTCNYNKYRFVWSLKEPTKYSFLEKNDRTRVLKTGSREEEAALSEAKYWIFNYRALDHLKPRRDQIYVQCWHGTPFKRLGYDISSSDNAMNSIREIRRKYEQDAVRYRYILSPCAFSTEKFISAWNLRELGMTDKVIETGYPRNDILCHADPAKAAEIREKLGLPQDRKVILYAPTWRDNQHSSDCGYTYAADIDFDLIMNKLGEEYVILFRAHYLVANSFNFDKYSRFIKDVSQYDDINELYMAADMLVTDYSSVFFDYAILKRPVIFYMYDLEEYREKMRGFYLDLDELPGEIVTDEKGLIEAVKNAYIGGYAEVIEKFNGKFNYLNDGNAAKRFAERCFQ